MRRPCNWRKWGDEWKKTTHSVQARIDLELYEELKDYAKDENLSIAEAIRTFIVWGLPQRNQSPKAL